MFGKLKFGLPVQLVIVVGLAIFAGDFIPEKVTSITYAISLSIKEILLFVMPFIIFSFIFSCLISFKEGTVRFLATLLGSICLSNFVCTLIAFSVSLGAIQVLHHFPMTAVEVSTSLIPAWTLNLYKLVPNDFALFGGLIAGVVFSFFNNKVIGKLSNSLKFSAEFMLNRLFIPILPLFILGFVLKMQFEGTLSKALIAYAPIACVFMATQVIYLMVLYGIGTNFKVVQWRQALKNVMPAALTAFSAMSSLSALPFSLKAAQQNTGGNRQVEVIVPSTVNVHLVGDSIAIPTMALAIVFSMGLPMPTLSIYLLFAFYFVINKFAVAAVPGGGILVMLPVLQQYLQFNDEMLSLITMLYILFDAVITMVNVLGNGAFAILFCKYFKKGVKGSPQEALSKVA